MAFLWQAQRRLDMLFSGNLQTSHGCPQVAFDKVGSMPMARIETIRVTKQADVDVELAKRSRSKQLREAVSMSERHAPHASQGAHVFSSPSDLTEI